MSKKIMPLSEDPNTYWFWLQPLPGLGEDVFKTTYAPNWEAKARGFVGPFSFREVAERERVDRQISGDSRLKLIPGGKKEAP